MIDLISLGAGVQSTTMALMAAHKIIGPMPQAAIFADTGAEPRAVYRHLAWLMDGRLPFPVHVVSAGNLRNEILGAMRGENRMDARPPFFTQRGGMLRRQCTHDLKLVPIQRKVREVLALRRGQRGPKTPVVTQWVGISLDEAIRMRSSRLSYVAHRYPLVDMRMTRSDCLAWLDSLGYPTPPKSACTFCPFHDDKAWRDMKATDPESFADAVAIDEAIRPGVPGPRRPRNEQWFVHRDRVPLAEVDLSTAADRGQLDLFGDECDGLCGV